MIFCDHVQWPNLEAVTAKGPSQLDQYDGLKKKLTDFIGDRWPVAIKFHPSKIKRIKDDEDPSGFRIEAPPEANITLEWTADGPDKRKHVWTYCENYEPDPVTKKNKYIPNVISIGGGYKFFQKEDIEFLMWLFLAFPWIEGGLNEKTGAKYLVFDLPHMEKKKANEFDTKMAEVLTLITNRKVGLSLEDARKMLTGYFVPDVDKMEDYEVMAALKVKATEGASREEQIKSMDLFLSRNNNAEGLQVRYLCQKAIEAGIIRFNPRGRTWNMIENDRPVDPPLCIVPANQNKEQVLHETMGAVHMDKLKIIEVTLENPKLVAKGTNEDIPETEPGDTTEENPQPKPKGNPAFRKKE